MRRVSVVRVVWTCMCVLGAMSSAMAAVATVEGVSINLPVPYGFCELDGSNPADKRLLDTIGELVAKQRGNQLLAMSADCRQLADWRAGRRVLGDYGEYQVPQLAAANEETLKETCAELRTRGGQIFSGLKDGIKARMEEAIKRMKVNEQGFAGFLGEEPTACYVALVQKLRTDEGMDITQLTLLAITMVKDKFLFVNRYAPYVNADTVGEILEKLKTTIASLLEVNPS